MQERFVWTPPSGALGRLCARAVERIRALDLAELRSAAACPDDGGPRRSLADALASGSVGLIAEIKRRSPAKGELNAGIAASVRAAAYASGGARALSVLTEPEEFGGSMADLEESRRNTRLPILKKDFHVDRRQVWEARALGASALLLIARGLGPARLADMMREASEAGMEALVEVRSERELDWALAAGASIIGVNCRDLETLAMEPAVHAHVLPRIPADLIAVAESGLSTRADIERVAALGADAVLVGSSLSRAADPAMAVASLTGVVRHRRGS